MSAKLWSLAAIASVAFGLFGLWNLAGLGIEIRGNHVIITQNGIAKVG